MQRKKIIEVVYNTFEIPGANPANLLDPHALRFRDAAVGVINEAMEMTGLGALVATEAAPGEVTARFAVEDFDTAENLIWDAVAGTSHAIIRELLRYHDEVAAA